MHFPIPSLAKLTEKQKSLLTEKTDAFQKNVALLLSGTKTTPAPEAFEAAQKLLRFNPEFYPAWTVLLRTLDRCSTEEWLEFDKTLLQTKPKSYNCYSFRKTLLLQADSFDLDAELSFNNELLLKDSRNFHAWDFRRFLLTTKPPTPETLQSEISFSESLFREDIHNNSVLVYRAFLRSVFGTAIIPLEQEVELTSTYLIVNFENEGLVFYLIDLLSAFATKSQQLIKQQLWTKYKQFAESELNNPLFQVLQESLST